MPETCRRGTRLGGTRHGAFFLVTVWSRPIGVIHAPHRFVSNSIRSCEPFAGTGTFVARLLQLGVIPPVALEEKYKNHIFANEFVLLSLYIASINIEQMYHQVRAEQGVDEGYVEFPGMTLTDTFQLHKVDGTITKDFEGLAANNERTKAEKDSAITVIVMNPPYSSGQNSANDNNQNLAYPRLDERIADTYGDAGITKEDIFFYVYALLHHPEYRERYEDDLKKMLPHIPRATVFYTYTSVGRALADLHVNYERVEPYPSVQEEASLHAPADPWERYRIGERKMCFLKLGRRDKDVTRLEYNDYVTLTGIPAEAQGYSISGRSPLEWIIDRYHVKTDKASGIVNDPNDFLCEQGSPDAAVDLIKRLVTVSMRTQELLETLPALEIPEQ